MLQDRLVKELRYAKIDTPEDANAFLDTKFLPAYNKKFAKQAAQFADHHCKLDSRIALKDVFSYRHLRVVQNDWTVQYNKRVFQLSNTQPCTIQPRRKIIVAERLDGTLFMLYNDKKLNFKEVVWGNGGHFYIGEKGDISIVA